MGNAFCMMNFGYGSREFEPQEGVTGQDHVAFEILSKIMTKKQIDKMWTVYCEIDVDQSGSIGEEEFRVFFNMEKGKFNSKLFSCFDADNSGQVNFFEFTCAVWNFLSTAPVELGGFIFFLFDNDKSGSLDFAEIKKIIEIIHSQDLNKTGSLQNKISRELENKPPHLNVDDFLKWTRAKPMLTNPVLVMQLKLQESAGGVSFWKMVTAQRNSNPVTAAPEYIYKEIARAEAIYSLFAKKKMATKKIDDMKGDVAKKSASSRPSDEKSLRRNSLMLGLMNLKEIKKPNRKNEKATFNVEKFRDENDMKFEGPKKGKKGDSGKTAVTISAIMSADDPIFVDSLNDNISNGNGNDTKTKPSSPSKKKGRSTIAVVNKDQGPPLNKSAKLDASEKFEKTESDKVEKRERQHRATVISPIGGRMPRNTIVGGSLPPIKAGLKKVD